MINSKKVILGIFINPANQCSLALLDDLGHYTDVVDFCCLTEQHKLMPAFVTPVYDEIPKAILVFGGDGTMLRAVDFALATGSPLLGINMGKLGFLSDSQPSELTKVITLLRQDRYRVEPRLMIDVELQRRGKVLVKKKALNDAVIYKGLVPRLIDLRMEADHRFVLQTRCDGLVVATPTGSTAYSLSAGGPILSPGMEALITAPLNPHILSVRPMVFSSDQVISIIAVETAGQTILQADGLNLHGVENGDRIIIKSAKNKIGFIKLSNRTFYNILRRKLNMGKL